MALEVQIQKKFDTFCLDVAFTAPNGTLGILGASGCGKSLTRSRALTYRRKNAGLAFCFKTMPYSPT